MGQGSPSIFVCQFDMMTVVSICTQQLIILDEQVLEQQEIIFAKMHISPFCTSLKQNNDVVLTLDNGSIYCVTK